ncbi:hypothetical protein CMK18_20880 [Candidatus Poribacteria bacterium]|nr:hypothetical protein [Candidatus Poribacteria bacterium]
MCTTGYLKDLGLIFKNRDKPNEISEEIVHGEKTIFGRQKGASYYSWGVNKSGCAFVSTAVNTPEWTSLVYAGKLKEADRQLEKENKDLLTPMKEISEMLSQVKNRYEWIDRLSNSSSVFMGYNIILADSKGADVVEVHRKKRFVNKLSDRDVVTNHFKSISHGAQSFSDYPSSFNRHSYALPRIQKIKTIDELKSIMCPITNDERKLIWRKGSFQTISSSILDFTNYRVFYSIGSNYERILF